MKLTDIKSAAETKYAHLPVEIDENETVLLRNVLHLSEDERAAIRSKPEEDGSEESKETLLDYYRRLVSVIADNEAGAKRLIEEFGENIAYYNQLLDYYNKAGDSGEA